jgi:hypothetical protein
MEDAIAAAELHLGRDSPRLIPLMVDLATIARNLGNLTEARAQLRRAYAIVVASAGPEHATSLSIEGRLAAVTHRLGEPTEAYDWHLADVGLRVLGADHPAVRGARQRLAEAPRAPRDPVVPIQPVGPITIDFESDQSGPAPTYASPTYTPPGYQYAPDPDPEQQYAPTAYPGVYQRHGDDPGATPPPAREYDDAEAWPESDAPTIRPLRRSGHIGGTALVASLGAAILVAAVVIAMQFFAPASDGRDAKPPPGATGIEAGTPSVAPSPTVTLSPPTDVAIKDDGGSVTLTWTDPSEGTVAFIVTGARDGETFMALDSVPARRTTSVIYGLNVRYDYCFIVSAVWSPDEIMPSIRTCTSRLSTPGAA